MYNFEVIIEINLKIKYESNDNQYTFGILSKELGKNIKNVNRIEYLTDDNILK